MKTPTEWADELNRAGLSVAHFERMVTQIQCDARCDGMEAATDLCRAAATLMRHQRDADCWHNLQNALARLDAARQAANNDRIASNGPDQGRRASDSKAL